MRATGRAARPEEERKDGRGAGVDAWVLTLLADLLPEEPDRPESLEARYLAPFRDPEANAWGERWLAMMRDALSHAGPDGRALVSLAGEQGLFELELGLLVVCYAVESEPMVGRCIAYLQQPLGTSRPTSSLLSAMLAGRGRDREGRLLDGNLIPAIAASTAISLGLVEMLDDSKPLPERTIRMPAAVALVLAAGELRWPGATLEPTTGAPVPIPPSVLTRAGAQAESLGTSPDSVLVLRCPSRQEARQVADAIARSSGARALFVDDADQALPALGPVCMAHGLVPVFAYDGGPGEQIRVPELPGYRGPRMVTAGLDGSFESTRGTVASWTIPGPTRDERERLWDDQLDDPELAAELASDHVHRVGRIVDLATVAKRHRVSSHCDELTAEEIRQAAWLSEGSGLSSLAQPLPSRVSDDALIVRPTTAEQLALLAQRCRGREELVSGLGASLRARYEMGVKALFLGPSGTGKTLAAGWLATRLSMPLYRVDMASITSKYVGETEKNLAKLLGQAERDEVMLLFDEADALFGKRTEVKDSNDRFANAQTNYLLQRIESYTGVVVLTSNSRARFDPAFTRRLDMMIQFPLPTAEERRAIWLSHLGTYHSLARSELNQLAVQCDFSGGHIRNAVLSAAVVAKAEDRRITMRDIVGSLVGEYRKLGGQLAPELKQHLEGAGGERPRARAVGAGGLG